MSASTINLALWWCLFLYWFLAARRTRRTVRSETSPSRLFHLALISISFALIFTRSLATGPLGTRWLPWHPHWEIAGTVITAVGIAFAFWARLVLGSYWSGTVTLKEDHRLIRSGPYRLARHPLYTGFLVGLIGTAVTEGDLRGLIALALTVIAFARKMDTEEQFLREQFGAEYDAYARDVKRIIPFIY